jgi:alpha-tubulin suppressor-like RCC1 family protein
MEAADPFANMDMASLVELAVTFDLGTLNRFCRTSQRMSQICRNQTFWQFKYLYDFGIRLPDNPGFDFRLAYQQQIPSELYLLGHHTAMDMYTHDLRLHQPPLLIPELQHATDVSFGQDHMAVVSMGQLYTFGQNHGGALGLGDRDGRDAPTLVPGLENVTAVSCGDHHTAAIADGRLYTFGSNDMGQLGLGRDQLAPQTTPTLVASLDNVTAVSCMDAATLAISNGQLYAFGRPISAGWGGMRPHPPQPEPRLVPGLDNITAISSGTAHVALISDGRLYTMGLNSRGSMGLGDIVRRNRPTLVLGLENVTDVSCGLTHTAVIADGRLYTFGNNDRYQLGLGDQIEHGIPALVTGLENVSAVACGDTFTAILSNRQLYISGAFGPERAARPKLLYPDVTNVVDVFAGGLESIAYITR